MPKFLLPLFIAFFISQCTAVYSQTNTTSSIEKTADSLFNGKQYRRAIDSYTIAISFSKNDLKKQSVLYDKRALSKKELDLFKEAIADENKALKLDPKNADAYWNRGLTHEATEAYQLAFNDYTAAMPYYANDARNLSILYKNIVKELFFSQIS